MADRIVVISLQKAGTHLVCAALEHLGYTRTGFQINPDSYQDRTGTPLDPAEVVKNMRNITQPIEETVASMPPRSFAYGHLPSNERCVCALDGVRKILLTRELRAALTSMFFFRRMDQTRNWSLLDPDRLGETRAAMTDYFRSGEIAQRMALAAGIAGWRSVPGVPVARYDDLRGAAPAALQGLAAVTGRSTGEVCQALWTAYETPTLTRSRPRQPWREYWTHECEKAFVRNRGLWANYRLGYYPGRFRAALNRHFCR